MANSAADARASEHEIQQKLIESRAVDVMVAVGPNMFYTVTLPCTLWFLDKGKVKTPRADTVLFIDARHIYRQVDRAHREWTPPQISLLANLVRLYRGEALDLTVGGIEAEAKLKEIFGNIPRYADVPGLCRAARSKSRRRRSLTPSRWAWRGRSVSDETEEQLRSLNGTGIAERQAATSKRPSPATWRTWKHGRCDA
jgi:type I restriction enzyme M protein